MMVDGRWATIVINSDARGDEYKFFIVDYIDQWCAYGSLIVILDRKNVVLIRYVRRYRFMFRKLAYVANKSVIWSITDANLD